jgi:phenylacetaldehyde dehydrogenase
VAGAANAIFFNHGQCCVAGSRLFVQQSRFDEVVEGVAQIARSITLGPGMDPGTQMGPLVVRGAVLTNTRPDMKVVRGEIFGPVVVAAPFSSLDEIAAANDTEYGLGAGIWTQDISKAHALAKKIRAGTRC